MLCSFPRYPQDIHIIHNVWKENKYLPVDMWKTLLITFYFKLIFTQ